MDSNYKFTVELLQKLISYKTVNPPGNERECILSLENMFRNEGFDTKIIAVKDDRLNLWVRYKGKGEAPPFLMYGHVDVVTAEGQNWKYDPFCGEIHDGCIWGRGALDMKGAVAMMGSALINMKRKGIVPAGDIILMIVSDEENGGIYGAKYVCGEYKELFDGVKYAIGEIGGFPVILGNRKFYPIMIGEKQKCNVKIEFRGEGGHGSMPIRGGAMGQLGYVLETLDKSYMPCHVVPQTRMMLSGFSDVLPFHYKLIFKALMNPVFSNNMLSLMKDKARIFEPLLHNTATPTIVTGGKKINVVPEITCLELDGRILPGFGPEDLERELKEVLKVDTGIEITGFVKGPDKLDMGLFKFLGDILKSLDSEAIPIPYLASGVTDARHFSRLGIQTYGFTPMSYAQGVDYSKLIHSADERIPVEALDFGVRAIERLLTDYGSVHLN